jgi:hypothetical protein
MLQIKSYTDYREFWHFAEPTLFQHEAQNNLVPNITTLRAEDKPEQFEYAITKPPIHVIEFNDSCTTTVAYNAPQTIIATSRN